MATSIWVWVLFNAFILLLLALDLGVLHRRAHAIGVREAALESAGWILLALLFNLGIYLYAGTQPALEFLTAYLVEKSLSIDNIFVFVLIFTSFGVPPKYQHRVLFWGILGALIMRGAMIGIGVFMIERFHWVIYVFGALLLFTAVRLMLRREERIEVEQKLAVRLVRRVLPVTPRYHGAHFFVRDAGRLYATPLLVVLALVESSDLIFAIDSIPAVFAVTRDPFLIYTSNVLAILGLRSLYFVLADVVERFYYLRYGLALILAFVSIKMLLSDIVTIPVITSLGVIAAILAIAIVVSLRFPKVRERSDPEDS